MTLTAPESDYLVTVLTNQLFSLLSRVNRWQTHSLTQHQYDQQVEETLAPELKLLTQLALKLQPTVADQDQLGALNAGIAKLTAATTYQLTATQLDQANERRMNRHYRH
ncbi:hypothetical protein [Lactiplantibacillus xiangfangensis]|uniref:Uncharacterized protein n=1 Tax=Lactiplantibacillus xiangfangensis TaxID=942150 RepID=A0A0R2M3E0_9LACO|nr:hypothetical protein [Lactiplantibacillus xiangfangensis]KRO08086.1 hypothetical protein IV64_GL000937 [Lactiplantibacillus xiangfangensis]